MTLSHTTRQTRDYQQPVYSPVQSAKAEENSTVKQHDGLRPSIIVSYADCEVSLDYGRDYAVRLLLGLTVYSFTILPVERMSYTIAVRQTSRPSLEKRVSLEPHRHTAISSPLTLATRT